MARSHNQTHFFKSKPRQKERVLIMAGLITGCALLFGVFSFLAPLSAWAQCDTKVKIEVVSFFLFYITINLYIAMNLQTFYLTKEGIVFYILFKWVKKSVPWHSIKAVQEKLNSKGELVSIILRLESKNPEKFKKYAIFMPLNKNIDFFQEINNHAPDSNPLKAYILISKKHFE